MLYKKKIGIVILFFDVIGIKQDEVDIVDEVIKVLNNKKIKNVIFFRSIYFKCDFREFNFIKSKIILYIIIFIFFM